MTKFTKIFTASVLATFGLSGAALADTANADFSASLASYCTVGQVSPGVMHILGTSVSTDNGAVLSINNNESGKYKFRLTNPSDFITKPNSYSGTTTFSTEFVVVGANSSAGTVGDGQEHLLPASGTDTATITLLGSSDSEFQAGNYTATVVATCLAQ